MTTEIVTSDFFKMADRTDESQIMNIDEFKDILCYKDSKSNRYELSYKGIKHLVLEMASKGYPLEVMQTGTELIGEGEEKTWYATVKMRNKKTGLETVGNSECPFYDKGTKDPFARTKALSKAERNAAKKQLPEAMIVHLVNDATKQGKTQTLKAVEDFCTCPKPQPGLSTGKCVMCAKVVRK